MTGLAVLAVLIDMVQIEVWLWDSNAAFTTVLDSPQAYGFIDNISYGVAGDFWG